MVKRYNFEQLRTFAHNCLPKSDDFEATFTMQDLLATVVLCAVFGIVFLCFSAPMIAAVAIVLI